MAIDIIILQELIGIMECFIFWRIMKRILTVKYNSKVLFAAAFGLYAIMFLKSKIFDNPQLQNYSFLGTIVLLGYSIIVFIFLFRDSFAEKMIWLGIYNFLIMISELIIMLLSNIILDRDLDVITTDRMFLYLAVMSRLTLILLMEAIIRRYRGKFIIGLSYYKEIIMVIIFNQVLLLGVVYVVFNRNQMNIERFVMGIIGVVCLITIYTVILIFRVETKSREELDTRLKLQQIELELKLNEDMIFITDRLKKLRHDMNNHIGIMKHLIHIGKYDDLEEYINQIYEDVEVANELVVTGNKTLSVLLNAKKAQAKSRNIDFTSMIATKDMNMQSKDICALLGNILDNAIEGAQKSGNKKYIQLSIQRTEEGCIIICENSLGIKPVVNHGRFLTNKDNTKLHGIGIENIKDIVSKYQGKIYFDYDDEIFRVRIVMPV